MNLIILHRKVLILSKVEDGVTCSVINHCQHHRTHLSSFKDGYHGLDLCECVLLHDEALFDDCIFVTVLSDKDIFSGNGNHGCVVIY